MFKNKRQYSIGTIKFCQLPFVLAALVLLGWGCNQPPDLLIQVHEPRPNELVTSPLKVSGEARGNWNFEGSFPVRLEDAEGQVIVVAMAQAQGDWMTTAFVPFEVILSFDQPATAIGVLVLEKANPSGLPAQADQRRVMVRFK